MFNEISYYLIFGKPLILYLGITTLSAFIITASIVILTRRRIVHIPMKYHYYAAYISLAIAAVHGSLALLAYY